MIVRRKHSGNFAVVPNGTTNDGKLKADTLGVLVYLLAKPHDWKVSIADIRKRFNIGRNRVYAILKELGDAGYVQRIQRRKGDSSRFVDVEYVVFDSPDASEDASAVEAAGKTVEPLPQIGEPGKSQQNAASRLPASPVSVMRKSGKILKTDSTNPLSEENSASGKAGADAPSVSKMIWDEGRHLFQLSPSKPSTSIIGKWLKRAASEEAREKLLGVIRAAAKVGTGDPVAYIAAAVNREFPPAADPKTFDGATWTRYAQAALKTKAWSVAWGPAPGAKGCLMPVDFITPELLRALSERRVAA